MLRFALRSLFARKVRLAMSTLSIVLGVAFLAGVLTFSHGLRSTFDNIVKGTTPDAVVQVAGTDNVNTQPSSATVSPADIAKLAALPEVAAADGNVNGFGVSLLGKNGKLVGGTGAPTIAFNHTTTHNLLGRPMTELVSGKWPGPGEVVLDQRAADRGGYRLGDEVTIVTPTQNPIQRLRLAGTAAFSGGGTAGAVLIMVDTKEAQRLFLDGQDAFNSISLTAADGVSQQQVVDAVKPLIPAGFEAQTGDKVAADAQSSISSILGVISTFLLVFAGIAVLVCALIIVNTFTILVAQRTRELAVVRALGASRRQITWSVLLEAALMAIVATAVGIAAGWALARGLAAVFRSIGLDIASSTLTLTASSIIACVVVGVLVTALAAYLPARRAGRIAPVAAMRADLVHEPSSLRRRLYVGVPALALGALCAVVGLVGAAPGNDTAWIGVGAVIWIITVATLSGVLGRPLLVLLTRVFGRLFGATGRIAGENAQRDPRRTGATASALMVGLALVSTIGVLAASLNQTVDDLVNRDFSADFIVQGPSFQPFPTAIGDELARVPGVGVMARQQIASGKLHGNSTTFSANDPNFDRIYTLDMVSGTQRIRGPQAVVFEDTAKQHHWHVGSTFRLTFPGGKALGLTVVGIAKTSQVTAPISIPLSEIANAGIQRQDSSLSINAAPGTDPAALHQRLDRVVASLPVVNVQDKAQFADSIRGQVNQLLFLIYGLLALAVVIAVLGIINTLGLSVIERTRELGLLRAIGVSRPQLRSMVTLESVAIALLGSVLGLLLGLVFGILLRESLSDRITSLGVPITQLVIFLVAAVVVGVIAAVLPAIRAGRLNVLEAIATE